MNDETKHGHVIQAQYVLIGPDQDPKALAKAFATLELSAPSATHTAAGSPVTAKIPTTNVRIWARPDGARTVEVTTPSGRAEVHLVAPRLALRV
jgi:hypothetical protein